MPLTWCELEGRVDVLNILAGRLCVGAPVQTIENYNKESLTLYNAQVDDEKEFSMRYTGRISTNYKESIDAMIQLIDSTLQNSASSTEFWSEVITFTLMQKGNVLKILMVITRPCALRYGIYKYVMCKLKDIVINKRLKSLELSYCVPLNEAILTKMGFHIKQKTKEELDDCPDMYMTRDELINVESSKYASKWDIKSIEFPSADILMSQQEVDRYNVRDSSSNIGS